MVWANCPTHGPVQDARLVTYGQGGPPAALFCSCGLYAEHFEPESFVSHAELVDLQVHERQPAEDHVTPEAPQPLQAEDLHTGGGWYTLPDGERVQGLSAAQEHLDALIDEVLEEADPEEVE